MKSLMGLRMFLSCTDHLPLGICNLALGVGALCASDDDLELASLSLLTEVCNLPPDLLLQIPELGYGQRVYVVHVVHDVHDVHDHVVRVIKKNTS